jgi:SpoVK/Ycf46/Vps4 family AAA+-type ATPase
VDPALERRVGWRIEIPPPDERARAAIWARLLPPGAPTDGSVDVDRLAARHPIAGGLFRTAVFRACYRAAAAGGAITHNLLDEAAAEQSGVEAEPRFRPRVVGGGVRKPRRRS